MTRSRFSHLFSVGFTFRRQSQTNVSTPIRVRQALSDQPDWLTFEEAKSEPLLEGVEALGGGEREAIAMAIANRPNELLIIDDSKGRDLASRSQIRFLGTLGVLGLAANRGLLDLPTAVERLLKTNFYVTPNLLKSLLDAHIERTRSIP